MGWLTLVSASVHGVLLAALVIWADASPPPPRAERSPKILNVSLASLAIASGGGGVPSARGDGVNRAGEQGQDASGSAAPIVSVPLPSRTNQPGATAHASRAQKRVETEVVAKRIRLARRMLNSPPAEGATQSGRRQAISRVTRAAIPIKERPSKQPAAHPVPMIAPPRSSTPRARSAAVRFDQHRGSEARMIAVRMEVDDAAERPARFSTRFNEPQRAAHDEYARNRHVFQTKFLALPSALPSESPRQSTMRRRVSAEQAFTRLAQLDAIRLAGAAQSYDSTPRKRDPRSAQGWPATSTTHAADPVNRRSAHILRPPAGTERQAGEGKRYVASMPRSFPPPERRAGEQVASAPSSTGPFDGLPGLVRKTGARGGGEVRNPANHDSTSGARAVLGNGAGTSLRSASPGDGIGAGSATGDFTVRPDPRNRKPIYPRLARQRGDEGTVVLEIILRADGRVERLRVARSSGHATLDRAAEESVRRWRFTYHRPPAVKIGARLTLPIVFSLRAR